jgi:hypothetical protein
VPGAPGNLAARRPAASSADRRLCRHATYTSTMPPSIMMIWPVM